MKFALSAVGAGSTARPDLLKEVAQRAEALGYESIWIPEHLAVPVEMKTPYPYSADGKFPGGATVSIHDPLLALAFAAGCTERIKLGTGVFVLPLRNPLAVAKAVASLDVLSKGRFIFGIGIGWLEEEFDAVGMPFKDRAARTREYITMLKTLWSDETPRFSGRFHSFPPEPTRFRPRCSGTTRSHNPTSRWTPPNRSISTFTSSIISSTLSVTAKNFVFSFSARIQRPLDQRLTCPTGSPISRGSGSRSGRSILASPSLYHGSRRC